MQGSPASVLEYVSGSSLRSGLQRLAAQSQPVSGSIRAAIALQAARGLLLLSSDNIELMGVGEILLSPILSPFVQNLDAKHYQQCE